MASGFALLLPGGGSSRRFGTGKNKLLEDLAGMPVFLHAIRTLAPLFDEILMAVPEKSMADFETPAEKYLPEVKIRFLPGGATRADSVQILAGAVEHAEYIAIHDAARPLIRKEDVEKCMDACRKNGSAMLCRKVTDTLKESTDGVVIHRTVSRELLWAAETPQMFRRSAYLDALSRRDAAFNYTDDAQMMERCSSPACRIAIVESSYPDPKITTTADLLLCEALLKL